MRFLVSALAAAALFVTPFAAKAASITYTVSNGTINVFTGNANSPTGSQQGTVNGTFTFNTTTNSFMAVDLTYTYTPTSSTYHYTSITGATYASYNGNNFFYTILGDTTGDSHAFAVGDAYLELNTSLQLCTLSNLCPGVNASNLITSTGVPNIGGATVTPTPEPSSLVMLGTGILGVAGVLRRKMRIA